MNILDTATGTILTPSYHGKECLGNGSWPGYECCCDQCDHFLTCYPEYDDELFAAAMQRMAAEEGARLIEENERLKNDPNFTVPEESRERMLAFITKNTTKEEETK